MEKKPIEVECVIRAEMTVIIPMDGYVIEEFNGDYGAVRDMIAKGFCDAIKEAETYTQGNMRVDNVRCKVFVKDEIGGNEE